MNDIYSDSLRVFTEAALADPENEARQLVAIIGENGNTPIDLGEIAQKRLAGIPFAYILGRTEFMGLEFRCTPDALIPRQETELLVKTVRQQAEERLQTQDTVTIVDMGTGSGNIAVSLAVYLPQARVLACDVSDTAVSLAAYHVEKYAVSDRVQLFCGDMFAPLAGLGFEEQVDIVVCNPPYIPTGSLKKLSAEIIDHEPAVALDAGAYGIDIFRKLIHGACDFLKTGGTLAFEIGAGQERLANRLIQKHSGYETAVFIRLDDVIRVVSAVKKNPWPEKKERNHGKDQKARG